MNKFKLFFKQIRAFFPSKLPVGMTEFDEWAESFFHLYKMPTQDQKSVKFTLATIIMHLGPTAFHKSKYYFYLVCCAGAAKQIAGAKFYDIKQEQQAAEKAKVVESTVASSENNQSKI